jgi:hypothetical protein
MSETGRMIASMEKAYISSQTVALSKSEYEKKGERYEGYLKDGKKDGKGKFIYVNGNYYDGEWKDNKKNGKGVYFYAITNERYEGSWVDNKKEGFGEATYAYGDFYSG